MQKSVRCKKRAMRNACDAKRVRCETRAMRKVCDVKRLQCETRAMWNTCDAKHVRCKMSVMHNACDAKRVRCKKRAMQIACNSKTCDAKSVECKSHALYKACEPQYLFEFWSNKIVWAPCSQFEVFVKKSLLEQVALLKFWQFLHPLWVSDKKTVFRDSPFLWHNTSLTIILYTYLGRSIFLRLFKSWSWWCYVMNILFFNGAWLYRVKGGKKVI